jgi:ribosome maturation factor RimP
MRTRARTNGPYGPFFLSVFGIRVSRTGNVDSVVNAQQLTSLITPAVEALGLECLGVEFGQHSSSSLLRIYIDVADRNVHVDDCEAVSREVSALLDVNDPISGHYTLEVSSPGFDRPLFTPAHFSRFIGDAVKLNVTMPIAGRKRFQGRILRVEDRIIVLDQDGVEVAIVHDNIEKARLVPDFGAETVSKPRSPAKAGKGAGKKSNAKAKKQ